MESGIPKQYRNNYNTTQYYFSTLRKQSLIKTMISFFSILTKQTNVFALKTNASQSAHTNDSMPIEFKQRDTQYLRLMVV